MLQVPWLIGVLALTAVCSFTETWSAPPFMATKQAASPAQSEADKKLADIMKSGQTPERLVPLLQQFIRENPEFRRLEIVYCDLLRLASRDSSNPDRTVAIADEVLLKFTGPTSLARSFAFSTKLTVLGQRKDDGGISRLVSRILEEETSVSLLENAARATSGAHAVALYSKAISERRKNSDRSAGPTLEGLGWGYMNALKQVGRNEEALAAGLEALELKRQALAEAEALGKDYRGPSVKNLRMSLSDRCMAISFLLSDMKQHDRALEYVALAESLAGNSVELLGVIEPYRARILADMGEFGPALASYVKSFAVNMNAKTDAAIRDLSKKLARDPEEAYRAARAMRSRNAVAIPAFELKTLDGRTVTLASLRSKATLVNFFYPSCGPCNAEFPQLQKLYVQYAKQGLVMVAINTHPAEDGVLRDWLMKGGYTFPILLSGSQDLAAQTYGVLGFPANFILNSEANMVFRHVGYGGTEDEPNIEAEVRELLGLKPFGDPPEPTRR
jgi:peroxiredoxin